MVQNQPHRWLPEGCPARHNLWGKMQNPHKSKLLGKYSVFCTRGFLSRGIQVFSPSPQETQGQKSVFVRIRDNASGWHFIALGKWAGQEAICQVRSQRGGVLLCHMNTHKTNTPSDGGGGRLTLPTQSGVRSRVSDQCICPLSLRFPQTRLSTSGARRRWDLVPLISLSGKEGLSSRAQS